MKFRTEIELSPFPFRVAHRDNIMLLGSCFTQNIGQILKQNHFQTLENPFGITFNPLSVIEQLNDILLQRKYTEKDLNFVNQRFISFKHHSVFTSADEKELIESINQHIIEAHHFLKSTKVLFISLGTAWTWYHKTKNAVVNNCHKVPATEFNYSLTNAQEITSGFTEILKKLNEFNPDLQVVFTISPVRHWRNGAVNNSRSKAILISAANQLADSFNNTHYFPSYEIMMDDLRDYRFYEDDLLHPSKAAINYIWQKFGDAFFSSQTQKANSAIVKINAMKNHRHINTNSAELEKFEAKLKIRIEKLKAEFNIDFDR